jgi:signal transduction histidine kinase
MIIKNTRHFKSIYLGLGLFTFVVLSLLAYTYYTSNRMANIYAPLIQAIEGIRYETTTAHMWVNEILSGESEHNMDEVIWLLDEADWYAQAILHGDKDNKVEYLPVYDRKLRQLIKDLRGELGTMRKITEERYELDRPSENEKKLEQHYDDFFIALLGQAEDVGKQAHDFIGKEIKLYRSALMSLVIISIFLFILAGILIHDHQNRLKKQSHLLEEEIKERKQVEKELLESGGKLKALASEITFAEENERRRIAIDMHEHVIQDLGVSNMKLVMLAKKLSNHECLPLVDEAHNLVEQSIKDTRSLVFDLSSPILYDLGLEAAIKWLAEETAKKSSFSCNVHDDGKHKPLQKEMQVILYRAVHELLTNIIKHSKANEVNIFIDRGKEYITISVQDDGIGFDIPQNKSDYVDTLHFGLYGISERLDLMHGTLEINSLPGEGTKITLTAPLESEKGD